MTRQRPIRRIVSRFHPPPSAAWKRIVDLAAEYVRRGIVNTVLVPEAPTFDAVAERKQRGAAVVRLTPTPAVVAASSFPACLGLPHLRQPTWTPCTSITGGATGGPDSSPSVRAATSASVTVTEHASPWRPRLSCAVRSPPWTTSRTPSSPSAPERSPRHARSVCVCVRRASTASHSPTCRPPTALFTATASVPGLASTGGRRHRQPRPACGRQAVRLVRAFAIVRQSILRTAAVGDGPAAIDDPTAGGHVHFAGNQPRPPPTSTRWTCPWCFVAHVHRPP
jgi:hypothetical protein